ncbi:hypothetical protein AAHA92_13935 [Salvia divinorum]|uniref:Uncharacterized protein n=1 Tax=Salvia divinorum TaxID=28513 RepID=A0ABD1HBA7_SALDI
MEEIKEENYASLSLQQPDTEEEEPHRLSFSHLPMPLSNSATDPSPRPNLLFEFSAADPAPAPPHSYHNDIVFCGKIIHEEGDDEDGLNEYQKRDYFATVKSKSLRSKPSSPESDQRRLSATARFSGELLRPKSPDVEYHVQRVNISSLTSMSAKSRRRMFMFGPVKFKPEMELSAIKQRQGKQGAAAAESGGGGRKGQWEMFKWSLKGRSHFTSVLARSLGCGGGGGWARQASGSHRLVGAIE